MRVLIAGGSGMLGRHVVSEAKNRGWEVFYPAHHEIDFGNVTKTVTYIEGHIPDVIVNCAGRVPSQFSRQESLNVLMANDNSVVPHVLAFLGIRLVHMSTDCVFRAGAGESFYRRRSHEYPDPDTTHGRTKLAGESNLPHVLNVRGSFVGWESGLLKWLDQARGTIEGWQGAWWNGTSAKHMAYQLCNFCVSETTGIVHVASFDSISKEYLLNRLSQELHLPVKVEPVKEPNIVRLLYPDIKVPGGSQIIDELIEEYVTCHQISR